MRSITIFMVLALSGCSLTFYGLKEAKEEPPPRPPVAAQKKPEPAKKPVLATNPTPPL